MNLSDVRRCSLKAAAASEDLLLTALLCTCNSKFFVVISRVIGASRTGPAGLQLVLYEKQL